MRELFTYILMFLMLPCYCGATTGDSLNFLTPKDTVFIKIGYSGEKIFEHLLEPGQTLFSMARFYGLKLEDVYFYNPALREGYEPGQKVKIPIPNKAIRRFYSPQINAYDWVPIFYQVKRGDTYYGIANRTFKIPVDTLFRRNYLPPDAPLQIGQQLHVGWMSMYGIPDSLRSKHANPLWRKSFQNHRKFVQQVQKKRIQQENGAAFWDKSDKGRDALYVLHRTAKIGSIIALSSSMFRSERTVYAKVIGRLSDRVHGSDVKIVVSPTIAKMMGAIDPKFFVQLEYIK